MGFESISKDRSTANVQQTSDVDADTACKPNQADELFRLGMKEYFWRSPDGEAWASIKRNGNIGNCKVDSEEFKDFLICEYGRLNKKPIKGTGNYSKAVPSPGSLKAAIRCLEANAPQIVYEPWVRFAAADNSVYIDLGDDTRQVVSIDAYGWRILEASECPVRFFRPKGMRALPKPQLGGEISQLKHYMNVDDSSFKLILGWLVGALSPQPPYAILCINSGEGCGKSTITKLLRSLLDPNVAGIRMLQQSERDIMIAAQNSWVLAWDNVSSLRPNISDALCQISTGAGFSVRKLYSDDSECILSVKRPQLLNGIPDFATKPDLLNRMVAIRLDPIMKRKSETELFQSLDEELPLILGALYQAVSRGLANRKNVRLKALPRMADFALWVEACSESFGWPPGEFAELLISRGDDASFTMLHDDPIASLLARFSDEQQHCWSGTATELLLELRKLDGGTFDRDLPRTPNHLMRRVRRWEAGLRKLGHNFALDGRRGTKGERIIVLEPSNVPSVPSDSADKAVRYSAISDGTDGINAEMPF
ncbi:MAG TPA: hypothetical protein VHW02_07380 [Rhizomicrobium sp.]|nr:hypothetical protein [Rhizomicrobium sp.]